MKTAISTKTKMYATALALALLSTLWASAQQYDILIKNGHLIDAKNGIDRPMDVALLEGKVAEVANSIAPTRAKTVIDAKGMYLSAGLIDIHSHNFHGTEPNAYLSNSFTALAPDGFSFRSGVTTVVDVGGSGWRNFRQFKEQVIDRSRTRVLSFLNIVGSGMKGGVIEQNLNDMDPKMTALVAQQFPNHVVGIKLAHYSGNDWTPTERAVQAGERANIPVMIDFGGSVPELPLQTLLLEKLRPGDIFTHVYAHVNGRTPVVDGQGKVREYVFEAQKRGIVMDVGHGGGSFDFSQAIPAMEQGLRPNSISTDLHTGSMNGGMKDLVNIMSKFLNFGMPLKEVIATVTWNPAQTIKRPDLGHISVGAVADITILSLRKGTFGFIDTKNQRIEGDQKLECELTIHEGQVVYDLNGISKPLWKRP